MVEYIRDNPVTQGRLQAQAQQRAKNQDARLEEQGFRSRYAHDVGVNTDRAVRSALGGVTAQGPAAEPQSNLRTVTAGGAQPTQDQNRQAARTPGFNPGGAPGNDRVVQELAKVEGGGALALKRYSENSMNHKKRQEDLEDKAWNMLANAKHSADVDVAAGLYKQASGQELPPAWRTKQAVLKIATIDAAARERYPRDVAQRRKFIEVGVTKGLETAIRSMAGESKVNSKAQMTPQQVFNMAKAAHTIEDPQTFIKTTDWGKVQAAMNDSGYGAQGQGIIQTEMSGTGSGYGMETAQAAERAQAEAEDKAGYFSADSTDFKDYGGSRERFITERTRQIMGGQGSVPAPQVQSIPPVTQEASALAAPQDPTQRQVGQVYRSPNGQLGKWTGQGWKIVPNGGGQNVSTGDPTAPVYGGGQQAQPERSIADKRTRVRYDDAKAELDQVTAEMSALQSEVAQRQAKRDAAAQSGHRVPQFENQDKQLQQEISMLETRLKRAQYNWKSVRGYYNPDSQVAGDAEGRMQDQPNLGIRR